MPISSERVLVLCEEIDEQPVDRLREMDREILLNVRSSLSDLAARVDRMILRLAFLDENRN
jgi:hypothetical protein